MPVNFESLNRKINTMSTNPSCSSKFAGRGSSFDVPLLLLLFLATAASAQAILRYVDANSTNATPPYTNWTTAARVIQDAVEAAVPADEIVVANGIYAIGGRAVDGTMTNRVAVDKPLTLRSINGPQFTVIQGCQVAGTTNGDSAVRCVYLADGASLSGFTLTNGATQSEGDSTGEQGGGVFCASTNATLTNCVLVGNSAFQDGGGAYSGTLNNCTISGNSASQDGGGAYFCTLNNCTLTGNSASDSGGGAYLSTLNNCTVSGNSANSGGGAYHGTLNNCTISGNSASQDGGGAYFCTLNNCTLTGNSAWCGGGANGGALHNCILYFNTSAPGLGANYYYLQGTLNYCCTTPQPDSWQGVGNLSLDPQLASASHLSPGSPCRGAGSAAYATGTDIDGESWANPPSIGCEEYHTGAVTGPLSVAIVAPLTNLAARYPAGLTALIEGRTSASAWDFGDGLVVSNQPYASHSWAAAGDYLIRLSAYNETHPEGVSATGLVHVVSTTRYVDANNATPALPYTNWTAAAATIQQAVEAADMGDEVVVTNGTYATGGRAVYGTMTNRVAVNKPLIVRSVNGPQFTVIQGCQVPGTTNGDGAIRCVYLTNGASLTGFTLTHGATRSTGDDSREQSGGGLWCESTNSLVTNCVIAGNLAHYSGGGAYSGTLNDCTLTGNSAHDGGGAHSGTLNNCTLTANCAGYGGGGASGSTLNNCALTGNSAVWGGGAGGDYFSGYCTLNNCTLTGNSAQDSGGGASSCALGNCIVYFNTGPNGANYDDTSCIVNYCCTTPQPDSGQGVGNLSLDPQLASAWHLSAGSPCRGAGSAAYATGTDIDGESWANPPSIGCEEYHTGAVTGPLSVAIAAPLTNLPAGYPAGLTALIEGRTSASVWDFGDGLVSSNQPYATHAWATAGNYAVVLWAYNDSQPFGVRATTTVHVVAQPVHYVAAGSTNALAPYTSWSTAAATIQDAVEAAELWALVLVTNGTYLTGGRAVGTNALVNRVAVGKPLALQSVNGPQFTVIQGCQVAGTTNGDGAIRCVYLADGASLSGFTLTNGATQSGGDSTGQQGGGVFCASTNATLTNCVLVGNSAFQDGGGAYSGTLNNCTVTSNSAYYGGGAYSGTLNNCTLTGNSASFAGGGASYGMLNNCTLAGNSAVGGFLLTALGGGTYQATLNNCTLASNSSRVSGGGAFGGTLNNCTVSGNSADSGGGVCNYTEWGPCVLNGCTLNGNSAGDSGGGAESCTLNNCTLIGNNARNGGGASDCWMSNCTVSTNSGTVGGGVYEGTLSNCNLAGNSARDGGGVAFATVNNCTLTGNLATGGGGSESGTLNNCALTGNSAFLYGGGANGGTLNNCTLTANLACNFGGGATGALLRRWGNQPEQLHRLLQHSTEWGEL